MAAVSRKKTQRRSLPLQVSRLRIFSQISQPIANRIKASGISVRTSVARRGTNKLKPKAQLATNVGARPYTEAARAMRKRSARPAKKAGRRHARSQDRVTAKKPAEIQPTSGGFVATHPFGVC